MTECQSLSWACFFSIRHICPLLPPLWCASSVRPPSLSCTSFTQLSSVTLQARGVLHWLGPLIIPLQASVYNNLGDWFSSHHTTKTQATDVSLDLKVFVLCGVVIVFWAFVCWPPSWRPRIAQYATALSASSGLLSSVLNWGILREQWCAPARWPAVTPLVSCPEAIVV